jgi:hypothetical protein
MYFILAWKWPPEVKICSKIKGTALSSCADVNLLPSLLILIYLRQIWKRCRWVRDRSAKPHSPWTWYLMKRTTWPWVRLAVTAVQTARWDPNSFLQLTRIAGSYSKLGVRLQLECVANYDKFAFFMVLRHQSNIRPYVALQLLPGLGLAHGTPLFIILQLYSSILLSPGVVKHPSEPRPPI